MKYKKISFWAAVSLVFAFMLFANSKTPYLADDYSYMLSFEGGFSLLPIIEYQANHYLNWGGRVVPHLFAQIFLAFDKSLFNIVNSFMFVALTVVIYKLCKNMNTRYNTVLYLGIVSLVWVFSPVFGQSNLWLVGSCNYLWGAVFNLIVVYIYKQYILGKQNTVFISKKNIIISIPFAVFAFIAGAYNENTSAACLVVIAAMLYIKHLTKTKTPLFGYVGLVSMLFGVLFLLLAPGNSVRNTVLATNTAENFFITVLSRTAIACYRLFEIAILVVIAVVLILFKIQKKEFKDIVVPSLLMIGAGLANYAMILTNAYPERAMFGATMFVISAVVMLCGRIEINISRLQKAVVCCVAFGFVLVSVLFGTFDIIATDIVYTNREQFLETTTRQDDVEVVATYAIKPLTKYSALYGLEDVAFPGDSEKWISSVMAQKFGVVDIYATTLAYDNWGTVFSILTE